MPMQDDPLAGLTGDDLIVREAHVRFQYCVNWESQARTRMDADEKFGEGDSDNFWQWPDAISDQRLAEEKPMLTLNKTRQHCLQIINDAKQNKPGVNIRPTGGGATYKAAQTFESIARHIEYKSAAEQAYDHATTMMVKRGLGYVRVVTQYEKDGFDKEIIIKRVKNPKNIYLDPDIQEADGTDAMYGFVFEDLAKDAYRLRYPKYKDIATKSPLGSYAEGWITSDKVRVAEYWKVEAKNDTLYEIVSPDGTATNLWKSRVDPELLKMALSAMEARGLTPRKRAGVSRKLKQFVIAGEQVISRADWPGEIIPIFRAVAEETVIDGIWDCKGHIRAMKDAQRMYNYNASASIEYGALQTKIPYKVAIEAITGFEALWDQANTTNKPYLPYNARDPDTGEALPVPQREQPPMGAPAYLEGMKNADDQMMMTSGQYQVEFGEQGNERSGKAIDARQRQGNNATYHYIDSLAMMIRAVGKCLIDLIPKIYDTDRVIRILADDGTEREININPDAKQGYAEKPSTDPQQPAQIIFNPGVGEFAVISDIGPAYATRRLEAFNALMQIIGADPEMMKVFGDLFFRSADFPMADEMADRARRMVPPAILGTGPPPEVQQLQQQVQQLSGVIKTFIEKGAEEKLKLKRVESDKTIQAYQAITQRIGALQGALPTDQEGLRKLVHELLMEGLGVVLSPSGEAPGAIDGTSNGAGT